jgi:transposase
MMSESQRKTSRPWEPQRSRQDAQSPDAKLPEGDVVFFLLDLGPQLDVRRFDAPSEDDTRGAPPFAPAMLVCLWLYAYGVGVFSSRTMAQACERHVALGALVGTARPACRTISDLRPLHVEALRDVFGQVRRVAGEAGLVKLGHVATAGTPMPGNASRHKAMRSGSLRQEADRLREASEALGMQAHPHDAEDDAARGSRRGDALPAELARRADRWATLAAARRRLEARAKAAAEAERQRRAEVEAARQRLGRPRRGPAPTPVDEAPDDNAPTHCSAPALPMMRTNKQGGAYGGKAQASGEAAHPSIGACDVTAEANAKRQAEPRARLPVASLEQAGIVPPKDAIGAAQHIPATSESGSASAGAAAAVEPLGVDPSMAPERQRRPAPEAESPDRLATAHERMAAKVRTPAGRAGYARRKVIVEPGCGQIKEGRGCRRFWLRGLDNIRGEGRLGCVPHNLLKRWRYAGAPVTASRRL